MILVLPTAEELRGEQDNTCLGDVGSEFKGVSWAFKFNEGSNLEPADVHGA
jgi:hypothetical protein